MSVRSIDTPARDRDGRSTETSTYSTAIDRRPAGARLIENNANDAGGDLHLGPASALKDAGDDASLPADLGDLDEATAIDLDELPRIVGAAVDLGAYELQ